MDLVTEVALISGGAGLLGATLGSLAPAIVARMNANSETRRERQRVASQLALAEYQHMLQRAQKDSARTGTTMKVPPIASVLIYYLQLLELLKGSSLELKPEDLETLRTHGKYIAEAISGEKDSE
jgi:hypothetical protein